MTNKKKNLGRQNERFVSTQNKRRFSFSVPLRFTTWPLPSNWCRTEAWGNPKPDLKVTCLYYLISPWPHERSALNKIIESRPFKKNNCWALHFFWWKSCHGWPVEGNLASHLKYIYLDLSLFSHEFTLWSRLCMHAFSQYNVNPTHQKQCDVFLFLCNLEGLYTSGVMTLKVESDITASSVCLLAGLVWAMTSC